jgi:hypothetical protein
VSGSLIGFVIEGFVALLLLVTIGYCVMLNRRLKRLRADEETLRRTIAELVQATDIAERAIRGLQETARQCDDELSDKLGRAERYSRTIEAHMAHGEKILARLARISSIARHHGLGERPSGGAAPSAEQNLSERAA